MAFCEYLINGGCHVAERECDAPAGSIPVSEAACEHCLKNTRPGPKQLNSVTASMIVRYLRRTDRVRLQSTYPRLKQYIECDGSNRDDLPLTATRLILTTHLSPGDSMTLTAAVECLKMALGDQYLIDVDATCREIWENNPRLTKLDPHDPQNVRLNVDYPTIHKSNDTLNPFLGGYLDYIARVIQKDVRLRTNRPHLYLSEEEKSWIGRVQEICGEDRPYWIVNAGIKDDFTCKQWPTEYYQEVINQTRDQILWVQIGEAGHNHQPLDGCISQIGQTSPRELIRLVYHSSGGLGPVTFLQHLCAAWEKPYLCLLGGREPVPWVTYPLQHTFHSMGSLDCCAKGACWRSRVVALGDGKKEDGSLCEHPVTQWSRPVAQCMHDITPDVVVQRLQTLLKSLPGQSAVRHGMQEAKGDGDE